MDNYQFAYEEGVQDAINDLRSGNPTECPYDESDGMLFGGWWDGYEEITLSDTDFLESA